MRWVATLVALLIMVCGGCLPTPDPATPSAPASPSATRQAQPSPTPSEPQISAPADPSPTPSQSGASQSRTVFRVFVVRHAERADDGTDDPPLTQEGQARAERLANLLAAQNGIAVYATQYQRAQSTAKPTSLRWNVNITSYDPTQQTAAFAQQVFDDHPTGVVLIVGHSDTVPGIVGAFCECQVKPISEQDFGNLFWVDLAADGSVVDFEQRPTY
ncbi:broad specificity phosphatase PhoE [Microlunatus panaciterrae]|uniref:Broad specificity phosphatase PhoE n=1 Tax=Microlunatus panaciterrae TaxID=400768 RepID=A0ABS2RL40_9ACTN|nr:phosphoglycerate mutase family protein [Microlunatus panaciterrae]MBM7798886.1 broad specificity phosphatase PhoE [Microlunatus panaciterrae]